MSTRRDTQLNAARDAGFERGWHSDRATDNPFRGAALRLRWERGRREGAAAQKRYWVVRQRKAIEAEEFLHGNERRCQAPVPAGCDRPVRRVGDSNRGTLCQAHSKRLRRGQAMNEPIKGAYKAGA